MSTSVIFACPSYGPIEPDVVIGHRLAVMHARKQIKVGQAFDHESIIGTHFFAEIVGTVVGTVSLHDSTLKGN